MDAVHADEFKRTKGKKKKPTLTRRLFLFLGILYSEYGIATREKCCER